MAHLTRAEVLASGEVSETFRKVRLISAWEQLVLQFVYHAAVDGPSPFPRLITVLQAFEARPLEVEGSTFFESRALRAEHLQRLRHLYPISGPIAEVVETMHNVPVRDGASVRVRVYQPAHGAPEGGSPLVMMYHEGGWCMGDLTDEDQNCRMFTRELGCVCVNVEYRCVSPQTPLVIRYIHSLRYISCPQ